MSNSPFRPTSDQLNNGKDKFDPRKTSLESVLLPPRSTYRPTFDRNKIQLPKELLDSDQSRELPESLEETKVPGTGKIELADVVTWMKREESLGLAHIVDVFELSGAIGKGRDPYEFSEPQTVKIFKESGDTIENRELLDLNMGRSGYEAGPKVDMVSLAGTKEISTFDEVVRAFRSLGLKAVGVISPDSNKFGPGWEWRVYVDWDNSSRPQ